ncbi:MAG TPA: RNA methyltransferase [Flavisolibacter sp.]|nr:RNA methyltransferase [Flavisolibacter sp.]
MLSKKLIKDIQSLGHKKSRDESGFFIAEGPKIINELLDTIPEEVESMYATEDWVAKYSGNKNVTVISDVELQRISSLNTPNQVVAIVKQFIAYEPADYSFVIYLDTIQDPGNFGTIIRIADWFGISHIVCSPGCADRYNPKVVQATMASIARVNVFYDENRTWLQKQRKDIYAATLEGTSVFEESKTGSGILMIGNESKGLSDDLMKLATRKITIPRKGNAESLNAAVATGIILSHLLST